MLPRRAVLACVWLAACAPAGPEVEVSRRAIAGGSVDTTHTAVVALLTSRANGTSSGCSGTVVQLQGGRAFVLTAAHCCSPVPPDVVVVSGDSADGKAALFGAAAQPPAYEVVPDSVRVDPAYAPGTHDLCLLQLEAPADGGVIAAVLGADPLSLGAAVEYVGFGATETSSTNSVRRSGVASVDQGLNATTLVSSQGGAAQIPGICGGDSGGPALFPADAGPEQQLVVGVASFGNNSSCAATTLGVSMRVSSASGFISTYLDGGETGTRPYPGGCAACDAQAHDAACASWVTACNAVPGCAALMTCVAGCAASPCIATCQAQAPAAALDVFDAYELCRCERTCRAPCAAQCALLPVRDGGTAPDGGSSDAGAPDAGSGDAGSDAGSGDAGSGDAGRDSGTPDAGTPDMPVPHGCGCTATPDSVILLALALLRERSVRARRRARTPW